MLTIRKKPKLIEVSRAKGCKILASLIAFKVATTKTYVFNKIKDIDPSARLKILRRLGLLARKTPQHAFSKWKVAVFGQDKNRLVRAGLVYI